MVGFPVACFDADAVVGVAVEADPVAGTFELEERCEVGDVVVGVLVGGGEEVDGLEIGELAAGGVDSGASLLLGASVLDVAVVGVEQLLVGELGSELVGDVSDDEVGESELEDPDNAAEDSEGEDGEGCVDDVTLVSVVGQVGVSAWAAGAVRMVRSAAAQAMRVRFMTLPFRVG